MPAFQGRGRAQLQHVIPPDNAGPVRVGSQDESRVGWLTGRRRRRTARGVRPVGLVQPTFDWCFVYGAGAPATGERFLLERP
jgi:hypothetical protein